MIYVVENNCYQEFHSRYSREYSQLKLVSSLPKDANLILLSIIFNMCILIVILCYMEYHLPKRK